MTSVEYGSDETCWVFVGQPFRPTTMGVDWPDGWYSYIGDVHTHPSRRRQGYATRVLQQVCADADERDITLFLVTDHHSPWLVDFYRRLGFVAMSRRAIEGTGRDGTERGTPMWRRPRNGDSR